MIGCRAHPSGPRDPIATTKSSAPVVTSAVTRRLPRKASGINSTTGPRWYQRSSVTSILG